MRAFVPNGSLGIDFGCCPPADLRERIESLYGSSGNLADSAATRCQAIREPAVGKMRLTVGRYHASVSGGRIRKKGNTNMSKATLHLRLKRAYEPAESEDGVRILIDRLWPRGVSKEKAALDEWMKDIAPSTDLRKWFGHDPARWPEFQHRYRTELRQRGEELDRIRALARKQTVTLVYSAHDEEHNDAVVLKDVLLEGTKSTNT